MRNSNFAFACLLIFSLIIGFHGLMGAYLNRADDREYIKRIAEIEEREQLAELNATLAYEQLREYQNYVATILPNKLPPVAVDPQQYQLRNLASVSRVGQSIQTLRGSSLFEEGKTAFRKKDFTKASNVFSRLIQDYPYSPYIVDALFLQAESFYQMGDFIEALTSIDRMVTLFPESEATGFALLRLGKIFEAQHRLEDAADIYRSVLKNYPSHDIQNQAQQLLKKVEI